MRIVVHIGVHKTGSTSIQAFLGSHRARLSGLGVAYYSGLHLVDNHVELHTATLRTGRATPFKKMSGVESDALYFETIAERVERFLRTEGAHTFVFSAEGLSYLRYPDECDRLRTLLGHRPFELVAYLRDVRDFKASYAFELAKHAFDDAERRDPESVAYLEEDSWLFDYAARLEPFREAFGPQNLTVLDYDLAVKADGGVIPAFLRTVNVEDRFEPADVAPFRLNARPVD